MPTQAMRAILSEPFKDDLLQAETHYFRISATRGEKFHARVKDAIRSVVWEEIMILGFGDDGGEA